MGTVEDEPRDGEGIDLIPQLRDELAGEEEEEIAIREDAEPPADFRHHCGYLS